MILVGIDFGIKNMYLKIGFISYLYQIETFNYYQRTSTQFITDE